MLLFSFVKLLNIEGFKKSFSKYDVFTRMLPLYGYIYPFVEACLGILMLTKKVNLKLVNFVIINLAFITLVQVSKAIHDGVNTQVTYFDMLKRNGVF